MISPFIYCSSGLFRHTRRNRAAIIAGFTVSPCWRNVLQMLQHEHVQLFFILIFVIFYTNNIPVLGFKKNQWRWVGLVNTSVHQFIALVLLVVEYIDPCLSLTYTHPGGGMTNHRVGSWPIRADWASREEGLKISETWRLKTQRISLIHLLNNSKLDRLDVATRVEPDKNCLEFRVQTVWSR